MCPHMQSACYCSHLRAAVRRTTAVYDHALAPVGVNIAQFGLMRRVDRAGAVSLTELARISELDRSTVGRNVRVLERLGLVRQAKGDDLREASVRLTAAGEAALQQALPLWEAAQAHVEMALGDDGVRTLMTLAQSL